MIEEVLKKVGAKIDSTGPIDYGTQYRVSRGAEKAIVNVYRGKKGLRIVVQQKSPLADELRGLLGAGEAKERAPLPAWSAWCGSDESGKGDFFGPLAVAAVGLTKAAASTLSALGVRDSKEIGDGTILELDRKIRALCPHKVVGWMPEEYNAKHEASPNVNALLGDAHAEAIAAVAAKLPGIEAAVVDQFGDEAYVEDALRALGCDLKLVQRPKADATDVAVGAASILARAAFVRGLEKLRKAWGVAFPKGAGEDVVLAARRFLEKEGRGRLFQVAKVHFKTAKEL